MTKQMFIFLISGQGHDGEQGDEDKQRLFDDGLSGISEDDVVAVRCTSGERGNDSFVSQVLVRYIVEKIRESGASVFLTDTNTL